MFSVLNDEHKYRTSIKLMKFATGECVSTPTRILVINKYVLDKIHSLAKSLEL